MQICALIVKAMPTSFLGRGSRRARHWSASDSAEYFVSIGAIDLLSFYGRALGPVYSAILQLASLMWVLILVALGFIGRSGYRWAFLAGMVLYGADMIALLVTFSIWAFAVWAFAVHAVFIFKWFQGYKLLKDRREAQVQAI